METRNIGFVGGGNMATALISGLLSNTEFGKNRVRCCDPNPESRASLEQRFGIHVGTDAAALVDWADCIVLAVKPQAVQGALGPIAGLFTADKLLISVAAGVTIQRLARLCGADVRIVRAMPNTPALVGCGATAISAGTTALPADVEFARALFASVGKAWAVAEEQLDAVTGLSGSGPAYVMLFAESLADGGVRAGLPRTVAFELAVQTLLGSATLLASGEHPAVLKDRVASPAGTTIEGLYALERGGFRHAVMDAVCEATARSRALGAGED